MIFYGTKGTFDTQSWTARGDSGNSAFGIVTPEHLSEDVFIADPKVAAAAVALAAISPIRAFRTTIT